MCGHDSSITWSIGASLGPALGPSLGPALGPSLGPSCLIGCSLASGAGTPMSVRLASMPSNSMGLAPLSGTGRGTGTSSWRKTLSLSLSDSIGLAWASKTMTPDNHNARNVAASIMNTDRTIQKHLQVLDLLKRSLLDKTDCCPC